MPINQNRIHILELCSEDAYGSWEFWQNFPKTEAEGQLIAQAIKELVAEKKIIPLEHKTRGDYKEVSLDVSRLEKEIRLSMIPNVDPDSFYWFEATQEGKKEDLAVRRSIKENK